ncbi:hypothetical protein AAVH_04642 [Aphelenchoides avenae]|nr:hypothetical protein AAVH_04642 [Aphelenchus avenae]
MRPLHFILGLAFVTTVLIANVDAIKCYLELPKIGVDKADCDELRDLGEDKGKLPKGTPRAKECITAEGPGGIARGCYFPATENCNLDGVHCTTCGEDLCNGGPDPLNGNPPKRGPEPANDNGKHNVAVTSTPPAPLLIAVITGVIAAVGI